MQVQQVVRLIQLKALARKMRVFSPRCLRQLTYTSFLLLLLTSYGTPKLQAQTGRADFCKDQKIDLNKKLPKLSEDDLHEQIKFHNRRLAWFQEHEEAIVGHGLFTVPADMAALKLRGYDLRDMDLSGQDLRGADLACSDLRGTNLRATKLGRGFVGIEEKGAVWLGSDLSAADLRGADIEAADLTGSDLSWALIGVTGRPLNTYSVVRNPRWGAVADDCEEVDGELSASAEGIRWTRMKGTLLDESNLTNTSFNPDIESLPNPLSFNNAAWTSKVSYCDSPTALTVIREELKKLGARRSASYITYAIRARESRDDLFPFLSYVLFDLTCGWGDDPTRPIWILGLVLLAFAVLYRYALKETSSGRIWSVYPTDRVERYGDTVPPTRVTDRAVRHPWLVALLFSTTSIFSIGWHDFNIGLWISKTSVHENTLKATGWVRSVGGIQSLVGLYLVALWALTYFGNPFDY